MPQQPIHTTVDDDLAQIEKDIRQLKIEYEMYFAGGRKRPPADTQWRVDTMIKRYNDRSAEMNSGQRFHLTNLTSTYAKYQEMWRKKLMAKETGSTQRHYGSAARAIEAERARVQSEVQRNVREREALRNPRSAQAGARTRNRNRFRNHANARRRSRSPRRPIARPAPRPESHRSSKGSRKSPRTLRRPGRNPHTKRRRHQQPKPRRLRTLRQKKTEELQRKGGKEIGYSVGIENGKVKLKARIIR